MKHHKHRKWNNTSVNWVNLKSTIQSPPRWFVQTHHVRTWPVHPGASPSRPAADVEPADFPDGKCQLKHHLNHLNIVELCWISIHTASVSYHNITYHVYYIILHIVVSQSITIKNHHQIPSHTTSRSPAPPSDRRSSARFCPSPPAPSAAQCVPRPPWLLGDFVSRWDGKNVAPLK